MRLNVFHHNLGVVDKKAYVCISVAFKTPLHMDAVDILYRNNLKRTSCREGIIEVVMLAEQALSEDEIKGRLSGRYDRTTFYRSFKTLEEHQIIHKIVIDNQFVKYALNNAVADENNHAHFYCNECKRVKCINSITIPKFQMPDGYSVTETDVLIKGICVNCNKK